MGDKKGQIGKNLRGENDQIVKYRYNQFKIYQNQNQYFYHCCKYHYLLFTHLTILQILSTINVGYFHGV